MKIGLFFGSFNPIHSGHLIVSTYIINFFVDKVLFVISPQNPFKVKSEILDIDKRIFLVKSAIKNNVKLEVSDIELRLPMPSYTINTLMYFKKNHPEHEYFLIMGSDNFFYISKWKSSDILLKEYNFLIYPRQGFPIEQNDLPNNIILVNAPIVGISSTEIRELIKSKKSIRYIVPDEVIRLIKKNKFYL